MKLPPLPSSSGVSAPDRLKTPEVPQIPQARILPVQALTQVTAPQPITTLPVRQMTQVTSPMPIQTHTNIANELALIEQTTRLAATVSKVYKEYDDQKTTYQLQDATLKLATHMQQWEMANRKETYSSFEVPGGLDNVRRTEKIPLPDGTVEERERNAIPAYEVFSKMYEREVKNAIESFSYGIERKREKDLWVGEATVKAGGKLVEVRAAELKAQDGAIRKEQESNITQAVKNNDKPLVDLLINNSNFSGPERQVMRLKAYHDLEDGRYAAALAAGTRESIEWAIAKLKDPNYDKNGGQLTQIERASRLHTLEHKAKEVAGTNAWIVDSMNRQMVADVYGQAYAGKLDLEKLQTVFEKKLIDPATYNSLIQHDLAVKAKGLSDDEKMNALVRAQGRNPGVRVVGSDNDLQKLADKNFDRMSRGLQGEEWDAAAVRTATEWNYVPKGVVDTIERADATPTNRAALEHAAKLYNSLVGANPMLARDFNDARTKNVQVAAAALAAGGSIDLALELAARERTETPQQKASRQESVERVRRALDVTGAQPFVDFLLAQPGNPIGFFAKDPKATPDATAEKLKSPGGDAGMSVPFALNDEYKFLFNQNLLRANGVVSVAERMTNMQLAKYWSLTNVNGAWQVMKYAPPVDGERFQKYLTMKYSGVTDAEGNTYKEFLIAPAGTRTSDAIVKGAKEVPYIVYARATTAKGREASVVIDASFTFSPVKFDAEYARLSILHAEEKREREAGYSPFSIQGP